MNHVAAIVVTYNRIDKLRNCIMALMMQSVLQYDHICNAGSYAEDNDAHRTTGYRSGSISYAGSNAGGRPDGNNESTGGVLLDILVIDNNSSDGTGDMVRDLAGTCDLHNCRIIYHNTGYNSGGAGGFCYGIRTALKQHGDSMSGRPDNLSGLAGSIQTDRPDQSEGTECPDRPDRSEGTECPDRQDRSEGLERTAHSSASYDYVWLMDDDSIPAPDALEVFLRAAEYLDSSDMNSDEMAADAADGYRWGFLSGRVLWRDGTSCKMNEQRQTVFRDVSNYDRPLISVSMASFVSLFINAQVVREVGLPLREFFIWTDDWEYTRRISRRYPCWLVPASTVVHDTTRNSGAEIASASAEDIWRFRYMYRNDVYLYRREGIRGYAYQAARLPVHAMRILLSRNPASEKRRRIRIIIRSTAEGIRFHPVPDRV